MNEPQTREERFFGVQHKVDLDSPPPAAKKKDEPPEIDVQFDDGETAPKPKAETKPKERSDIPDDFEADFGDDFDPELKQHLSGNVQKRIRTLTWEREQAKRERDEAQRIRDEAYQFAQSQLAKNQQLQSTIDHGEAYLVQQMEQAAEQAAANAEAKYKKALEEGDSDAIIAAQREIIKTQAQQDHAANYKADYERRRQQMAERPQQQQPVPQRQAPRVELSERQRSWGAKNKWFHGDGPGHGRMTSYAYGVHADLMREGVPPDSDEYYERIDQEMRKVFPEQFNDGHDNPPPRKDSTVVADGGRNDPGRRKSVRLSPSERAVADKLGLSYEQYAAEKLRQESTR